MTNHTDRAIALISQRRYSDAERELGRALAQQPDDAWPHAWLALCLAERDAHAEAAEHGRQAMALAPDSAEIRRLIGRVALARNDLPEAERLLTDAVRLDPYNADAFSARAAVHAQRKHWTACLNDTDQALQLDPDNVEAINLRSLANRGLGRPDAGADDMAEALRIDPNDARSHANLGWAHLQQGELPAAETHFREALRLEPTLDWARVGVLETIKAKFPVYRWVLGYFMWMGRLTGQAQFAIIIGLFVLNRLVRGVADANPALAPFLTPLLWLYGLFAVATWFIQPLGNATLLFHPFARMALTRWEKIEALVVASLFTVVLGLVIASALSPWDLWILLAIAIGAPGLPLAMSFKFAHPTPYRILLGVTQVVLLADAAFFTMVAIEEGMIAQPGPPLSGLIDLGSQLFLFSPLAVLILVNVLAAKNWRR